MQMKADRGNLGRDGVDCRNYSFVCRWPDICSSQWPLCWFFASCLMYECFDVYNVHV